MPKDLRVLFVKDSEDDAELVIDLLKQAGYEMIYDRVDSAEAMKNALNCGTWDVVICDYSMPAFDARNALEILNEAQLDIPFIAVSGAIGEEVAVQLIKSGANDYVMKDKLDRLVASVEQELSEAEVRRAKRKVEEALRESTERYLAITQTAREGFWVSDETGRLIEVNDAYCTMIGFSRDQLVGMQVSDLESAMSPEEIRTRIRQIMDIGWGHFETQHRCADGSMLEVEVSVTALPSRNYLIAFLTDITGRKLIDAFAEMRREVLQVLYEPAALLPSLQHVLAIVKKWTGFDAIGIRLQHGEDFPYFAQVGFQSGFLQTENTLCERNTEGGLCRDKDGHVSLQCTCGLVISGKTDPSNPLFTEGGSCWMNDSSQLLDIPPGKERRKHPRNKCVQEGYASLAFVPIWNQDQIIGLFQFGDRRKNRLSLVEIELLEGVAAHVGAALIRKRAEEALYAKTDELHRQNTILATQMEAAIEGILVVDEDAKIVIFNRRFANMWEIPPEILASKSDSMVLQSILPKLANPDEFMAKVDYLYENRSETSQEEIGLADSKTFSRYSAPMIGPKGQSFGRVWFFRDVTQRKQAEEERMLLQTAIELAGDVVVISDSHGIIKHVNSAFERITGYTAQEAIGQKTEFLSSGLHPKEFYANIWETLSSGRVWTGRFSGRRKDGRIFLQDAVVTSIANRAGEITSFVEVSRDVTEQVKKELELQQVQKLESIGQLAAGIAHEINTPMQYVNDNAVFLKDAMSSLVKYIQAFELLLSQMQTDKLDGEVLARVIEMAKEIQAAYLVKEIPQALDQALEGISRVTKIVLAMKEFSHPGLDAKTSIDLNKVIESTITISRHEWKYVAEMLTDLAPDLPAVPCYPGIINQVILNLITNAAHAVAEAGGSEESGKGKITISTRFVDGYVEMRVADTGAGIPEGIRDRVFDPFFTTKGVGKGTGQGLAMAHATIVERHSGHISFESETGKGTIFIVKLPVAASS